MKKRTFLTAMLTMGAFTYAFSQQAPAASPAGAPAAPAMAKQQAPPKKTAEDRATDHAMRLQKSLVLDKEQYDKVYAIDLDVAKQREAKMVKGDREANMALSRKLEDDRQARIMAVLKPAQKEKYKKMLEEEKSKLQMHMPGGQPGGATPPPPPAGGAPGGH